MLAAVAEAVRGHAESGEPALNEALRLAPDDPHLPGEVWGARAHRSLLASDHSRALVELELTVANGLGEVIASPHVGLWLLMSASATGTLESLPAGIMASRWNRAYLRFAEAVVLGRDGRASEAAAAFAEADAEMWEPVDVRWHRRHARRVVAEAALADGWGDPVRRLTEDLPFFETLGHDRIASACRGLLRRAGAPVPRRSRYIATIPEELRRLGVTSRESPRQAPCPRLAAALGISAETAVAVHVAARGKRGRGGDRGLGRAGSVLPVPRSSAKWPVRAACG